MHRENARCDAAKLASLPRPLGWIDGNVSYEKMKGHTLPRMAVESSDEPAEGCDSLSPIARLLNVEGRSDANVRIWLSSPLLDFMAEPPDEDLFLRPQVNRSGTTLRLSWICEDLLELSALANFYRQGTSK